MAEEIENLNDIENEEKRSLFIEATGANEGIIVNDQITFEDWYIEDKFKSDNIKISDDTKAYIDDLSKRKIIDKKRVKF